MVGVHARAVGAGNEAQDDDAGDEGAHETHVDQEDEARAAAAAVVGEEGADGPDAGEDRGDEEDEDVGRRELVLAREAMHEVCQQADGRDEGDDLEEAEEGEENGGYDHRGACAVGDEAEVVMMEVSENVGVGHSEERMSRCG